MASGNTSQTFIQTVTVFVPGSRRLVPLKFSNQFFCLFDHLILLLPRVQPADPPGPEGRPGQGEDPPGSG